MSAALSSDAMHNLVKFIICLAIAGMVIALVAYFILVLPGQQATTLNAPANSIASYILCNEDSSICYFCPDNKQCYEIDPKFI